VLISVTLSHILIQEIDFKSIELSAFLNSHYSHERNTNIFLKVSSEDTEPTISRCKPDAGPKSTS
jgi:hypothetical protein